jgi:hypothetical protein
MDWLAARYAWWQGLDLVAQVSFVAGIVGIAWAAIAGRAYVLRKRRERAAAPAVEEGPQPEDSPPSFAGLGARPPVNTEGFLAREAELARLNQLVTDGKRIIWVTGPTQAGKTWLVSRWV